jgi:uncharacterized protein (TIGR02452 family)
MYLDRRRAREVGQETVRILEAGSYTTAAGATVDITAHLRRSVEDTRSYPPEDPLAAVKPGDKKTLYEVVNESTLTAARRLVGAGHRPAALNFASAKHPGGGFLSGGRAQEESLARSSGLYTSIASNPMYSYDGAKADALYSRYAIYSPDVPVLRDDDGALLAAPYPCSFITCAAVNANVLLEREPARRPAIREQMRIRIGRVLNIAAMHEHSTLVLGAWGCGVFGNDSWQIAELFHQSLTNEYRGVFERVVFATFDSSEERRFIGPFQHQFGSAL